MEIALRAVSTVRLPRKEHVRRQPNPAPRFKRDSLQENAHTLWFALWRWVVFDHSLDLPLVCNAVFLE